MQAVQANQALYAQMVESAQFEFKSKAKATSTKDQEIIKKILAVNNERVNHCPILQILKSKLK